MSETSDEIDPREVAHHEAAHTVFHLKLGMRQGRVTIRPDASRGTLGQAQLRRPKWINHPPTPAREEQRLRIQAENEILALYAGRIAQAKYAGRGIDWGHEGDDQYAMRLATHCVSEQDDVRYAFLVYCQKQAAQAVEAWWPEIQAVAQALFERKTLSARECRDVIAAIPDEVYEEYHTRRREA
jgi:hypothetical protein